MIHEIQARKEHDKDVVDIPLTDDIFTTHIIPTKLCGQKMFWDDQQNILIAGHSLYEIRFVPLQDRPELKPCPFCGEVHHVFIYAEPVGTEAWRACIRCENCEARGPSVRSDNAKHNVEEAAKLWNREAAK